ncbi:calcium-responsive transcription factor [Lampris incognitus]|uniref:calcium-responsive transcription factor n=1 Tax=Lampris incognitus TaxID=2546036 RepID=UPI0024B58C1E|nr:calcium-responsive transcription factor [Lampris incognitus]
MNTSGQNAGSAVKWDTLLKDYRSDEKYMHGYVTSESAVNNILELYRRETSTTFTVRTSSPLSFDPLRGNHKFSTRSLHFDTYSSPKVNSGGMPFTHGGKKILECQFGPRKDAGKKGKVLSPPVPVLNPGQATDHDYQPSPEEIKARKKLYMQDTRKKGCEAKITVWQICLFPDYTVTSKKMIKVEQTNERERLMHDLNTAKEVRVENRYYIDLPLKCAHSKHSLGGLSGMAQTIHPQIVEWIYQLVAEGMTDAVEMQATLRHYVKTKMVDVTAPDEMNRAYYPRVADIKNHIYKAKVRQRLTKMDPKNVCGKSEDWKANESNLSFRPHRKRRSETSTSSLTPLGQQTEEIYLKVLGQPASTFHAPEDGENVEVDDRQYQDTLLLVHPEQWQKDDMKTSGNSICLVDASYTAPSKENMSNPAAAIIEMRKNTEEELEVLRAMICNCNDFPALEALSGVIKAQQEILRRSLHSSEGEHETLTAT